MEWLLEILDLFHVIRGLFVTVIVIVVLEN